MGSVDAALAAFAEDGRRRGERPVPGVRVALLRADMERDAVGVEAEPMGVLEHVDRHRGLAAELARQRPFGAVAVEQDAAEDARAGRGAGDLLDLLHAVDGEQAHAALIGARDVALLLDGVAEGDAVRLGAGGEHHLDLGDRGGVEARARARPGAKAPPAPGSPSPRRRRGVRQRLGEGQIVFAHDVEVDDEAGPFVDPRCAGTRGCARSLALSPKLRGR